MYFKVNCSKNKIGRREQEVEWHAYAEDIGIPVVLKSLIGRWLTLEETSHGVRGFMNEIPSLQFIK